jgi:hypothetical protein
MERVVVINRFAGADLSVTTNFDAWFGIWGSDIILGTWLTSHSDEVNPLQPALKASPPRTRSKDLPRSCTASFRVLPVHLKASPVPFDDSEL